MSQRSHSKSRQSRSQGSALVEDLEGRTMMSVGPATIAHAGANDSVFDQNTGTLHVVYFDTQSHSLKAQSFRSDGTVSAVTTIDAGVNAGMQVSVVEDAKGIVHAAYYDATNGDLKYARRTKGGMWSTQTIDSNNTVGQSPSIAIDAAGRPAISYYAKSGGNLRLAEFNGSAFAIKNLMTTDDVGRHSSLALSTNGKLAVAFDDVTTGHVMYAEEAKSWKLETVATTPLGNGTLSLNFGTVRPALSYYDATNGDLRFAQRSAGGVWYSTMVASAGDVGLVSDLSFTYDTDSPAIVYYDQTADAAMFAFRSGAQVWTLQGLTTGGGASQSVADGIDDGVHVPDLYVVYSNTATGDLQVVTL